jgi:hypothetical protein
MKFGFSSKGSRSKSDMEYPDCGIKYLRRVYRRGFLQKRVMAFFGYYPWECPVCRIPHYLRGRREARHTGAAD